MLAPLHIYTPQNKVELRKFLSEISNVKIFSMEMKNNENKSIYLISTDKAINRK